MALLSEKKVLLFNPSLIKLMENLQSKGWNNSEKLASFGAFLIDRMHFELDPEARPYEDLCQVFQSVRSDRENDAEF